MQFCPVMFLRDIFPEVIRLRKTISRILNTKSYIIFVLQVIKVRFGQINEI